MVSFATKESFITLLAFLEHKFRTRWQFLGPSVLYKSLKKDIVTFFSCCLFLIQPSSMDFSIEILFCCLIWILMAWEYFVFLSPHFNHLILDLKSQNISSLFQSFLVSSFILSILLLSCGKFISFIKFCNSSFKTLVQFGNFLLLQYIIVLVTACSFSFKLVLANKDDCHAPFTTSLHSTFLVQKASNQSSFFLFFEFAVQDNNRGLWSDLVARPNGQ